MHINPDDVRRYRLVFVLSESINHQDYETSARKLHKIVEEIIARSAPGCGVDALAVDLQEGEICQLWWQAGNTTGTIRGGGTVKWEDEE